MPELTLKQERFVDAYLATGNQTEAAKQAGYSERSAHNIGYENVRKRDVAEAIAEKVRPIYTPERLKERLTEIIESPDNQTVAVRAIELGMRSEAMLIDKSQVETKDVRAEQEEIDRKAVELAIKLMKESVDITKVGDNEQP